MELLLETPNIQEYLRLTEVIDFNNINIVGIGLSLTGECGNDIELVKRVFEYVRDEIAHSGDIKADTVTCKASEVLVHKHGICCAKAHLLAAILRYLNIPTGFCYQWLISNDDPNLLELHGLNGVYLYSVKKWIRLDARGNKTGVNAEFNIEEEKLAWPVRQELGEIDIPIIYASPKKEVIDVLKQSANRNELRLNWISVQKNSAPIKNVPYPSKGWDMKRSGKTD